MDDRTKDRGQSLLSCSFQGSGKAADMPKLDDKWNLGLWLGNKEPDIRRVLRWHFGRREATPGRKMVTEMNGDPWNPTAHHQDKPFQVRGVYITLERQIKYGGTKTCAACFGNAKVHSPECRARFQDTVDIEAALTAVASASRQRVAPRPIQVEDRCRLRPDPRQGMTTWKLQRTRQHGRRVL